MFKEMRRKDRLLNNDEIIKILKNNAYGVLSTISDNGYPYGVPISYVLFNDSLYVHSALKGHKLDNISNNNKVSFTVIGNTQVLPGDFSTKYESVIIFGDAVEVFEDEKDQALLEFINKYSIDFIQEGKDYIEKARKATRVMKIDPVHVTGKAKR